MYLAEQGYRVDSVDSSAVGIGKARRLAATRGVSLNTMVADLADFSIEPARYTGVVSIFCHLPPGVRAPLHRQVVEGLQPGGVLILEAYTPEQLDMGTGGPPVAELTMTLDILRTELAGLQFEHALETEREVVEGRLHTGLAKVVQLVARKPA